MIYRRTWYISQVITGCKLLQSEALWPSSECYFILKSIPFIARIEIDNCRVQTTDVNATRNTNLKTKLFMVGMLLRNWTPFP